MSRLRVDWCSNEAATYAVKRWHYSRTMPVVKTVRLGVWWDDEFKGAVIFSRPCRNQHLMFGLRPEEVCELGRVRGPESRAVTEAQELCLSRGFQALSCFVCSGFAPRQLSAPQGG